MIAIKQTRVGDGIITKKMREPIPEDCIHVYPRKKVAIGLSRSFWKYIEQLGVVRFKRNEKQTFDHDPLPATVDWIDDWLDVTIHSLGYEGGNCEFRNFMLVKLPKLIEKWIKEEFEGVMRIKLHSIEVIPPRNPGRIEMLFNMKEAELVGSKLPDVRRLFE